MAGGRPRIARKEEFCSCCGNRGYNRLVMSWNPEYKETSRNYYRRFRHDDRNYVCPKCKAKECYVETELREREAKELPTPMNPLADMIKYLGEQGRMFMRVSKLCAKFARGCRSWPTTPEENRMMWQAFEPAKAVFDTMNIMNWMEMVELRFILEGKELPESVRAFFDEMYQTSPIKSESDIDLMLELLRRTVTYLDRKYGVNQRREQKQSLKKKLHDIYNYPGPVL